MTLQVHKIRQQRIQFTCSECDTMHDFYWGGPKTEWHRCDSCYEVNTIRVANFSRPTKPTWVKECFKVSLKSGKIAYIRDWAQVSSGELSVKCAQTHQEINIKITEITGFSRVTEKDIKWLPPKK